MTVQSPPSSALREVPNTESEDKKKWSRRVDTLLTPSKFIASANYNPTLYAFGVTTIQSPPTYYIMSKGTRRRRNMTNQTCGEGTADGKGQAARRYSEAP